MEDAVDEINTLAKAIKELITRSGETGVDFSLAISTLTEKIENLSELGK